MTYLFCAYRDWALELYDKLAKRYKSIILIKNPKKLSYDHIKKVKPKLIFFPDWSWIIPSKIISEFQCICFHESNLPKFRGGSPLQNQIIRGVTKTKTSAFLMTEGIDQGHILLQKDLSLEGSLRNIFDRMIKNDYEMIVKIIQGEYSLKKQKGKPSFFRRRKPEESELDNLDYSKRYLYDFIRMLADPYPNAFIKIGKRKIVFKSVDFNGKYLKFNGEIE